MGSACINKWKETSVNNGQSPAISISYLLIIRCWIDLISLMYIMCMSIWQSALLLSVCVKYYVIAISDDGPIMCLYNYSLNKFVSLYSLYFIYKFL